MLTLFDPLRFEGRVEPHQRKKALAVARAYEKLLKLQLENGGASVQKLVAWGRIRVENGRYVQSVLGEKITYFREELEVETGNILAHHLNEYGYITDDDTNLMRSGFCEDTVKELARRYGYCGGELAITFAKGKETYIYMMFDLDRYTLDQAQEIAQRMADGDLEPRSGK